MPKKVAPLSQIAGFIETMDCLPVSKLPEGPEWTYELKLDGYRLEAVTGTKEVTLYSRRRNVLNERFGYIATALEHLPLGTVVDGEIVALGRMAMLISTFCRSTAPRNRISFITFLTFSFLRIATSLACRSQNVAEYSLQS